VVFYYLEFTNDINNGDIETWFIVVDSYFLLSIANTYLCLRRLKQGLPLSCFQTVVGGILETFFCGWTVYGDYLYFSNFEQENEFSSSMLLIMMIVLMYSNAILYKYFVLVLAILICFPIVLCIFLVTGGRPRWTPAPAEILTNLSRNNFDRNIFKTSKECVICMEDFKEGDQIVVLPCDPRHYFHDNCIESWFTNNGICPICRTTITRDALELQEKIIQMHLNSLGISKWSLRM